MTVFPQLPTGLRPAHEMSIEGFQCGHSTVADGSMSYTLGPYEEVLAHRKNYFAKEGVPSDRMITFFTEHGEVITDLQDMSPGKGSLEGTLNLTTDVIVHQTPNAGIFLGFADCVPYAVYDRRQHLMAFAHLGWRSMALGLAGKLLRHLKEQYQSQPEDLVAVIGPSIKPQSYLFHEPNQWSNPIWHPYLERQADGRTAIDLFGFCVADTEQEGLQRDQMYAYWADTGSDSRLYSHYMATEGGQPHRQGRHLFYAYLK